MRHDLIEQLKLHEGLRLKPYTDTVGKTTIGIGRNLDDKGIRKKEAYYMLKNDLEELKEKLKQYGWYKKLNDVRKKVVVDMAFNLGLYGMLSFEKMISAIQEKDYEKAADEMLDSKWSNQVGQRANRLAKMMRTGADYDV